MTTSHLIPLSLFVWKHKSPVRRDPDQGSCKVEKPELTFTDWVVAVEAGVNGVRMRGRAQPEFFKVQLRAIVRVAAEFPVKIMFPMIATQTELRAAKVLLEDACGEVRQSGGKIPARLEVGMMVEIPASAVQADRFAPEVDFFSIGINDRSNTPWLLNGEILG